ncbi:MAG: hypothetical protein L6Q92_07915 [Phycisphaerae bacterium]|nr:hypothetical protein [Phycisphaerae bacterium]
MSARDDHHSYPRAGGDRNGDRSPFDREFAEVRALETALGGQLDVEPPEGGPMRWRSVVRSELAVAAARSVARPRRWIGAIAAGLMLATSTSILLKSAERERALQARMAPLEWFADSLDAVEYEDAGIALLGVEMDAALWDDESALDSEIEDLWMDLERAADESGTSL